MPYAESDRLEFALTVLDAADVARAVTGGELVVIEGAGHLPHARDPVRINLEIDAFVRRLR